jgi:hypothetical protein
MKTSNIKIVKRDVTEWSIYIPKDLPSEINNESFLKDTLDKAINEKIEALRKEEERKQSPHHHTNRLD